MQRLDGKRRASRQVPADDDFIGIKLADSNFAALVHLERARHKRECPERSAAENDEAIFSTILDLMDDPAWEGVQ
jgi:hypothetical protein